MRKVAQDEKLQVDSARFAAAAQRDPSAPEIGDSRGHRCSTRRACLSTGFNLGERLSVGGASGGTGLNEFVPEDAASLLGVSGASGIVVFFAKLLARSEAFGLRVGGGGIVKSLSARRGASLGAATSSDPAS